VSESASVSDASQRADELFKTVLECKDRADSIRNTLNVLQRFKVWFIFALSPFSIQLRAHDSTGV